MASGARVGIVFLTLPTTSSTSSQLHRHPPRRRHRAGPGLVGGLDPRIAGLGLTGVHTGVVVYRIPARWLSGAAAR